MRTARSGLFVKGYQLHDDKFIPISNSTGLTSENAGSL